MQRIGRLPLWLLLAASLAMASGCDGDDLPIFGPGEKEIYSGQFLDSAVANLDYHTPTRKGTTGSRGEFSYLMGESVAFHIGGVELGESAAQAVITPVNLVSEGSTATPAVRNMARFLLALDQDGNPDNGITISEAVRLAAESWDAVDFAAADFDSKVSAILSSIGVADGRTVSLPDAADAARHLEQTIFCAYSGGFIGVFSGGSSSGEWMLNVNDDGEISGVGRDSHGNGFRLEGVLNPDSRSSFWADYYPEGATQPEARWEGTILPSGAVNGSWESGSPPRTISLAGSSKRLTLPPGTKGQIYRGTLEQGSGSLTDTFVTADVGIVLLAIDNGVINGKGYLYLENSEFTIPETSIIDSGFQFTASGKQFIGRLENDTIIFGFTDLDTGNIGGGTACKLP